MGVVPQEGTPFGAMRERFLSQLGIPCQKPPFGTMSAIDLKTRKLVWQVPVGTVKDTGPLGIRMHLPIPIGMPTLGASLATQSGLLFFAGTQDFYLRAFDTGERQGNLEGAPAGGQPVGADDLCVAEDRQAVHRAEQRRGARGSRRIVGDYSP
jgi:glucose dehydrogenase